MKDRIKKALKSVKNPGFDKDIVSLGMLEDFTIDNSSVTIKMKPFHATNEVKQTIASSIEDALKKLNLKAIVEFPSPPTSGREPKKHTKTREIPGVKRIIPIASGKGGVGKSMASVNIAIALSKAGKKVGLLDLDIYGPSIPTMLALNEPQRTAENGKLRPIEKHGLKIISIGLMMDKSRALQWRGPWADKAVKQFSYDVNWKELDYLILDLPPGTGDIQISLLQNLPIFGAVMVSTPQDVALDDVGKAIDMFNNNSTRILGIIENMCDFLCPHCGKELHIFGTGGDKLESRNWGVPLLGQIPLDADITQTSDSGEPIVLSDGPVSDIFRKIAEKIINEG